jgi:hypothetical protein
MKNYGQEINKAGTSRLNKSSERTIPRPEMMWV